MRRCAGSGPRSAASRPGRGSVFRLWLDRWQGALEDDTAQAYDARSLVGLKVLDDHVSHCVAGALASGDEAEARAKTDELLAAVQRFAKTR